VISVLQQLGIGIKDVFLAGVAVGILWGSRNRRVTGERIGVVEEGVAEVRGLLKAIAGNGERK
jgi:hypothetical protein